MGLVILSVRCLFYEDLILLYLLVFLSDNKDELTEPITFVLWIYRNFDGKKLVLLPVFV